MITKKDTDILKIHDNLYIFIIIITSRICSKSGHGLMLATQWYNHWNSQTMLQW